MGFRGRRQEVEGWGDGVIASESMRIKKVRFHALRLQDPSGRPAKTMQNMCVYTKECFCVDGLSSEDMLVSLVSVRMKDSFRSFLKQ